MPVLHGQVHQSVEIPAQPTWVGGEGEVFKTIRPAGYVVKRPKGQESLVKARILKSWLPKPAHAVISEDELSETPGGPPVAFLLPFVTGVILFVLTYPDARARAGITVTSWHLRRAARNLAVALADVHRAGLLVGDLNHMNVLVTHDDPADPCKVKFIDSDSFQFGATDRATGCYRVYRTGVGVPEFLAPELQGLNLRDVDRTAETDRFALAVMVWMLLFDGAHPFSVRSVSGGPIPSLEDCIRAGHSNVTPGWPSDPDLAPVVTRPEIDRLPPAIRYLFTEAFVSGHAAPGKRPTAAAFAVAFADWERADPMLPTTHAPTPPAHVPANPAHQPSAQHGRGVIAAVVGCVFCLLLGLVLIGSAAKGPKPAVPPATAPKPAEGKNGRFDDAPALWREAAKEGK
jgi:serine/threonine protein kinase